MNGIARNVLFLCSGNSARSIMAEALLRHWGGTRFRAFSAGSQPKGFVDPIALDIMRKHDLAVDGLRSKSWDEFAAAGAPEMDFVFIVCETCREATMPRLPGNPLRANWSVPDPAQAVGTEAERTLAYREAFRVLESRIKPFVALRHDQLTRVLMKIQVDAIGVDRSSAA